MSFNRGFRHGDDRVNSYQPSNQRPMQRMSNISPWEGGVVPSARPSNSQGLLALPTSQLQQNTATNLMSAQQLALASSLLSSLGVNVLPNQQQQQQRISQQLQFQQAQLRNDNLPALLRMNRSQVSAMGNSQPSFHQQGQRNNIPGDRFRNMDTMRNRMYQNMTNNRVEPYSKNRPQQSSLHQQQQQRRTFINKARGDRKPPASLNKPGSGAVPDAAGQKPKFRKPVKVSESTNSAPNEQEVESKTVDEPVKEPQIVPSDGDLPKSTDRDIEELETKRDWKDEKNDIGIEKAVDPPSSTAAEEQPDNSAVVTSEEPILEDVNNEAKEKVANLLCHICNVSVDNIKLLLEHTKLESHKALMEKTSASYQAQAAALRLNMQEVYGRNDSLNRNNRHDQYREFCKMCKLNFVGSIASHRKMKEHLQLKTFLHPRCLPCSKEFTTRIEWDAHRLSASHQLQEQASLAKAEAKAAAGSSKKKAKEAVPKVYQPNRIYGYHYMAEGFFCRVCEKFFDKRPLSRMHLQSQEHFDLCIAREAKEKEKKTQASDVEVESCADPMPMEPAEVEVAPDTENSITKPSEVEANAQAEPESEGSDCKRQKLSEDSKDETSAATLLDLKPCDANAESCEATDVEENHTLSANSEDFDGEDVPEIPGFVLDDDINTILDESGLDLGGKYEGDVKEEGAKLIGKNRRGGRATRGRKRK